MLLIGKDDMTKARAMIASMMLKSLIVMTALSALLMTSPLAMAMMTKSSATVNGPLITLGDVLLTLPDQISAQKAAETVLASAPLPGESLTLSRFDIDRALQKAGFAHGLENASGYIKITRAGHRVPEEIILKKLADDISRSGNHEQVSVRLTNMSNPLYAALSADLGKLRIEALSVDETTGRFTATLAIPHDEGNWNRVALSGMAEPTAMIPVLVRNMNSDEVISRSDIDWIEMSERRINRTMIRDASELIGLAPVRMLRAGQALRTSQVQRPLLVTKGSVVTMFVRNGALTVSATGKAMQDGAKGDFIRLLNTASNRTVEARVTASGVVEVMNRAVVAASQ
jgi:flagella basal body P-ring formation protein FlgA